LNTEAKQAMNVNGLDDYREGLFWLVGGLAFVVLGLAQWDDWHGIQPWLFYVLGLGLILVMTILASRVRPSVILKWRAWLPIIIGLIVSVVVGALSDEVGFAGTLPLVSGLLWIATGLWLMLRPETPSNG
jgi:hypothetical protein